MVGNGHGLTARFGAQPLEPVVTQLAGGHFDADLVGGRVVGGGEVLDVERHAEALAELADKQFVALRLFAAQVEVAVGGMTGVAQTEQQA